MENKITHTAKDLKWIDESGTVIPFNRITPTEKLFERSSAKLIKGALALNKQLSDFKKMIQELSAEAFEAFMKSKELAKESKGNFTWYNFNRSIKIEVSNSEPIKFDDLTILAAKDYLDQFLNENIESKNEFVKDMITDAFSTQRNGQLDVKQVLKITKYKVRVGNELFTKACDCISEAIRRPSSKTYFRIWLKDENGKYQNIDLNISSL
ncbi:DUF3164 family protein [Flavobacterium sp. F-65]|uniref:DUF3164 family protein n=1 Tax=Flavobacterium pisciphilum TaxID=2893755 RepID=A0ABS8MUL4_9FLAO|nr:DUF3164 family protein [Flavobacterium sp. F-65]MCC9072477.1 DUF3164 family protein [Flavobacterium sp. F-65]